MHMCHLCILTYMMKNCKLFENVDEQIIDNEIEPVLQIDEDDSEEMQRACLEDLEKVLDNPGLQGDDESTNEDSQSDDDDLDSNDDSDFNLDIVLSAAHVLDKELHKYNEKTENLKEQFDECADSIRDFQHKSSITSISHF